MNVAIGGASWSNCGRPCVHIGTSGISVVPEHSALRYWPVYIEREPCWRWRSGSSCRCLPPPRSQTRASRRCRYGLPIPPRKALASTTWAASYSWMCARSRPPWCSPATKGIPRQRGPARGTGSPAGRVGAPVSTTGATSTIAIGATAGTTAAARATRIEARIATEIGLTGGTTGLASKTGTGQAPARAARRAPASGARAGVRARRIRARARAPAQPARTRTRAPPHPALVSRVRVRASAHRVPASGASVNRRGRAPPPSRNSRCRRSR